MRNVKDYLDKYEDWLLNSFRRLVSFLSMLLLIGCVICLLGAGKTFLDSYFPEEFENQNHMTYQPSEVVAGLQNNDWEVDWESVESVSRSEAIDDIVDILEKYYRLRSDVYDLDKATADLDVDADDVIDTVVKGVDSLDKLTVSKLLLQYFRSMDKYYSLKLSLKDEDAPTIPADITRFARQSGKNEQIVKTLTTTLENPWRGFIQRLQDRESLIDAFDQKQARQRAQSMQSCLSLLSAAGVLFGIVCFLTIVLLIFKAENSLRRQADAQEDVME